MPVPSRQIHHRAYMNQSNQGFVRTTVPSFTYRSHRVATPTAPFPWKPGTRGSPVNISWPPKGKTLIVDFDPPTFGPVTYAQLATFTNKAGNGSRVFTLPNATTARFWRVRFLSTFSQYQPTIREIMFVDAATGKAIPNNGTALHSIVDGDSGHMEAYAGWMAADGNLMTYWDGVPDGMGFWLSFDLGSERSVRCGSLQGSAVLHELTLLPAPL